MNRVHSQDYRVIRSFLSALDCPRSLGVLLLLENEQYKDISELSFDPLWFNDLKNAEDCLVATEFLRKYDSFPGLSDTSTPAYEKFKTSEDQCSSTNDRFLSRAFSSRDSSWLFAMQSKIRAIMGVPPYEEIVEYSGWGPGVTLFNKGDNATPFNKFRSKIELTLPLYQVLSHLWNKLYPHWDIANNIIVEGNRITTVPKNSQIDRVIAVEPSVNLWFQKGVGSVLRNRLLRAGIDLRDQTSNQRLAAEGSKEGLLATVDFSSASDTISAWMVVDLLPSSWSDLLWALRSPRGLMPDGSIHTYSKFSSMGNGFTFELESIIFLAAALAVCPEDHPMRSKISIYGDDLIIPVDIYDDCIELFTCLGFTINKRKSYSTSYYRESCGKHFWNGTDITPIYFRSRLSHPQKIFTLHNAIRRYAGKYQGWGLDKRFKPVCDLLKSYVERSSRLLVSDGYGDCGFIADFDEAVPSRNRRYQRGFNALALVFIPSKTSADDHAVLLTRLWRRSTDECYANSEVVPRRGRWLRKKLFFPVWLSSGGWC